jgi:hypothetical protein
VGRFKAEPGVKAVRIGSRAVRRKLGKGATARAALGNRPFEQSLTEAFAAPARRDPDRFHLSTKCPAPSNPWNERKLQRSDYLPVVDHHGEKFIRIRVDRIERPHVFLGRIVADGFSPLAERIVREQCNDGGQFGTFGSTDFDHEAVVAAWEVPGNDADRTAVGTARALTGFLSAKSQKQEK